MRLRDRHPPTKNDALNEAAEETVTIVVYEETLTTYRVPVEVLRDLGLPTTPEELSDTTELTMQDIDEERIMDAVDGIKEFEFAVQERQISFPTDA
jgi:hypothetical protein